jgi:hypothetical protein
MHWKCVRCQRDRGIEQGRQPGPDDARRSHQRRASRGCGSVDRRRRRYRRRLSRLPAAPAWPGATPRSLPSSTAAPSRAPGSSLSVTLSSPLCPTDVAPSLRRAAARSFGSKGSPPAMSSKWDADRGRTDPRALVVGRLERRGLAARLPSFSPCGHIRTTGCTWSARGAAVSRAGSPSVSPGGHGHEHVKPGCIRGYGGPPPPAGFAARAGNKGRWACPCLRSRAR